jgi:hypothetical protein
LLEEHGITVEGRPHEGVEHSDRGARNTELVFDAGSCAATDAVGQSALVDRCEECRRAWRSSATKSGDKPHSMNVAENGSAARAMPSASLSDETG